MKNPQTTYSADAVKAAYERQHPDRSVVLVCTDRNRAIAITAGKAERTIDLSYGFCIVTDPLA